MFLKNNGTTYLVTYYIPDHQNPLHIFTCLNFIYVVCSKSIRIGNVVVVHWVGCVSNQS